MKRTISGSEAFVEALQLEGVDLMFGIVGSAFMDPLDIFPKAGIRFLQVRHEQNAALMAEGYARASGRIGVCIGQNGPGVTNLVTGVASAQLNHTPLVVFTPGVTSASADTNGFQEIDQIKLFAPIVKHQIRVNRPDRISQAIRGAFRAALALRGPAQVDIPRDYFYGTWEEAELLPEQYRTSGRFGGAPKEEIERAAQLLASAKRPFIVVGLGAVDSEAATAIAALAERFNAPVGCVFLHNDAFPGSHPLSVGPIGYQGSGAAMRLMKDADVVLALGTRLNSFGTTPQYGLDFFPHDAKLIHNSINPLELGAQKPIAVGLVGDCKAVTEQLLDATADKSMSVDLKKQAQLIETTKNAWAEELTEMSMIDSDPISPRRALLEISRNIPKDTIVVPDIGNVAGTASAYFSFDTPRRWIGPGSLGGIGVGFSTALGAKLGQPDLPVLSIIGDGSWSMTLQEVMTAKTEKINLVTVLLNNGQYGAEKRNQYDFFEERFFSTNLDNPDFSQIVEDMGVHAKRITRVEDIAPALEEAFNLDQPVVIEIIIDKVLQEPYRRDALRVPQRSLEKYRS